MRVLHHLSWHLKLRDNPRCFDMSMSSKIKGEVSVFVENNFSTASFNSPFSMLSRLVEAVRSLQLKLIEPSPFLSKIPLTL